MHPISSPQRQLALNLRGRDASSFGNFFAGGNREPLERVRALVQHPDAGQHTPAHWLFLWGEAGTGKTHLLEAACRATTEAGRSAMYVPLRSRDEFSPALLEDAEHLALVCLDDAGMIAGDPAWEQALFVLYERLRAQRGLLMVAARTAPAALGLRLADLATRLAAGLVYQLQPLDDQDKVAALRLRATQRGMEMGEDVARYLLTRFPRDTHSLFALLDRLDDATFIAQRRLTIPFLRSLE